MHLDAMVLGIVERAMAKARQIEIAAKFAVHPRQDIQIELSRDAGGVVIGGVEHRNVLDEVDADDHGRALPQYAARLAEKLGGILRLEIADGRAREEPDARARTYL